MSNKKNISKITSKIKEKQKILEILIIFLIFICGLLIRLYLYPTNSVWIGDAGRDMLAGYLIAFRNMSSRYGPYNTGISFVYPPIYYYFIALLTMIAGSNHLIVASLIITYQSLGIVLTFIIIKKEFSKLPAFVISLLYALSPCFIYFSMLQISVSNSSILVLLSLALFQLALRDQKTIKLIMSGILLSLATSFWYGSIFMLPVFLLIILINIDKNKAKKSNLLTITIFLLSVVFSFLLFFIPIIKQFNISNIYQLLFGNGLNQLTFTNFKLENFLESFNLRIQILHPKLTLIMYVIYCLILLTGLFGKNKHTKKFILVSIFTLLFHFIFYNIHRDPLGHYLNNVFFVFAGLLALGLQIALEKNKIIFLILTSAILISSQSFSHERLYGNLSYQHSQQVSNLLYQYFPDSSILNGGEFCINTRDSFYWESRVYWYFQKEKPYFLFDDINNQVSLINPNTIILCWKNLYKQELDKDYLINKEEALLKFKLFNFEYLVFDNE